MLRNQRLLLPILSMVTFAFLLGCGSDQKVNQAPPIKIIDPVVVAKYDHFKFDETTGLCKDSSGNVGKNTSAKGECGQYSTADLSQCDTGTLVFRGADLRNVDLSNCNLNGVDARGADFRGAHLSKLIQKADLSFANLSGVDLRGRNLDETKFINANLSKALLGEKYPRWQLFFCQLGRCQFLGS